VNVSVKGVVMRQSLLLLFLGLIVMACGHKVYMYEFSGSAILKDKSVVNFEIQVEFKNKQGVKEITEKMDKVNHAIRIILVQRSKEQIDRKSRLVSVASKIFKSQLTEPVKRITVTDFVIEPVM
jgi:flagellar basal body-associated protein FliL